MLQPLNELTKKNIPFIWTKLCHKSLDYAKQVTTTSPILAYPDPDKQYYLFMDTSKHSWGGILIEHTEQTQEGGAKRKYLTLLHTQVMVFNAIRKMGSTLTKEAYTIYMSFYKMVCYLEDTQVMIRCDHALLCKFIYPVTKNDKVNN